MAAVRVTMMVTVTVMVPVLVRVMMMCAQGFPASRFNRNRCTSAAVQQQSSAVVPPPKPQIPTDLLNSA
jgi:hypothetical protein